MSEPTLSEIGDYDVLQGDKKRVVWLVVAIGICLGIGYYVAGKIYNGPADSIKINDTIKVMPISKNIPVK